LENNGNIFNGTDVPTFVKIALRNFILEQAMKAERGNRGIALLFL
jgi:hypothetical protein